MTRSHELRKLAEKKSNPEADWWFQAFEDQCKSQQEDLIFLAPWLVSHEKENRINANLSQVLDKNKTLKDMARLNEIIPFIEDRIKILDKSSGEEQHHTRELYVKLEHQVKQGSNRAQGWIKQLALMAGQCQSMADIDYEFLYDPSRQLLSIGYNASSHKRDESFYDLLASESRL